MTGLTYRPSRERSEYELLQKPCPLGLLDSVRWHWTNFRRIRPYDAAWARKMACIGFAKYLQTFLQGNGSPSAAQSALNEFRRRTKSGGAKPK